MDKKYQKMTMSWPRIRKLISVLGGGVEGTQPAAGV